LSAEAAASGSGGPAKRAVGPGYQQWSEHAGQCSRGHVLARPAQSRCPCGRL